VNLTVVLLIGLFAALWSIPVLLVSRGNQDSRPIRRAGAVLAIYTSLFLVAAWWWHVPLDVQKNVRTFVTTSSSATVKLSCEELNAAAGKLEEISVGAIARGSSGSLVVSSQVWVTLNTDQRNAMEALAEQLASCAGPGATGEVVVREEELSTPAR
jgi:hypothetical protein